MRIAVLYSHRHTFQQRFFSYSSFLFKLPANLSIYFKNTAKIRSKQLGYKILHLQTSNIRYHNTRMLCTTTSGCCTPKHPGVLYQNMGMFCLLYLYILRVNNAISKKQQQIHRHQIVLFIKVECLATSTFNTIRTKSIGHITQLLKQKIQFSTHFLVYLKLFWLYL